MRNITTVLLSAFFSFSAMHLAAQNYNPTTTNTPRASAPQNQNYSVQPSNNQNFSSKAEINWCESYSDSMKFAKGQSKPLLILFTGTAWCPACMKLEREVLNKPEFARAVANNFVFYKAEFNDPSPEALESSPDKVLIDRYNIEAFPTIVVIDTNGNQLFTVNYKAGGPQVYANELNQKLQNYRNNRNQSQASNR